MKDLGTARPHAASYAILRKGQKIAFVLRENTSWMAGYYGLPAGKVEEGETFTQCVLREAKEEVGVDVRAADARVVLVMHRDGGDGMSWVDIFYEIDSWEGEPQNAEPHVHKELAWLDIDDLPENVIPNVRYGLEQLKEGNAYCEFGWA